MLSKKILFLFFVCFCRKIRSKSVARYPGTAPRGWHTPTGMERRLACDYLGHSFLELATFPSLILIISDLIVGWKNVLTNWRHCRGTQTLVTRHLVSFDLLWYIFLDSLSNSTWYRGDFTGELTYIIPFNPSQGLFPSLSKSEHLFRNSSFITPTTSLNLIVGLTVLSLVHVSLPFTITNYVKNLPKFQGNNVVDVEDHVNQFMKVCHDMSIEHEDVAMKMFV